jgi:ribosome-interacting GTPase 1
MSVKYSNLNPLIKQLGNNNLQTRKVSAVKKLVNEKIVAFTEILNEYDISADQFIKWLSKSMFDKETITPLNLKNTLEKIESQLTQKYTQAITDEILKKQAGICLLDSNCFKGSPTNIGNAPNISTV